MPTVEFTLEDIRQVVREEVDRSFDAKFQPAFDRAFTKAFRPAFDQAFGTAFKPAFDQAFAEAFLPAFDTAFEPHALAIQQDFNRIHDKLAEHDERFDRLEQTEVRGLKRIVDQHSKEIIELRAHLL